MLLVLLGVTPARSTMFSSLANPTAAHRQLSAGLRIYFIDVEGGASTLIVTPAGESILIDAGWVSQYNRDSERIVKTMKEAGVTQIDHMIITHYHADHWGGFLALSLMVPVMNVYDHGPLKQLVEDPAFPLKYDAYQRAAKGKTKTLTPGQEIKLKQTPGKPRVTLTVLAAAAKVIQPANPGPPNPACDGATLKPDDPSDNARSVASLIRYGDFDFLVLGDLTWNIEQRLVCPSNLIGKVDLFQVTHHGLDSSNSPALLRSVDPTAAVMPNGARKAGLPDVIKAVRELPSMTAFYQLHRNLAIPAEANAPEEFIANLNEEKDDQGFSINVATDANGKTFTITNTRNGKSTSHPVR